MATSTVRDLFDIAKQITYLFAENLYFAGCAGALGASAGALSSAGAAGVAGAAPSFV
jgi:hypothetical protein